MLRSVIARYFVVAISLVFIGCDSLNESSSISPSSVNLPGNLVQVSDAKDVLKSTSTNSIPKTINGIEFSNIRGWLANLYPWEYAPQWSAVHPVSNLWTSNQKPSLFQVAEQCRQIKEFGGGAAVLEYSTNPNLDWHNYWVSNGFAGECGPFFLLYEHVNGTLFIPVDGFKDMNNPYNRQVFKDDIDFMFKNVIVPNQSRYVTAGGRAVIYMWSSVQMEGDFASLLEEVKKEYPVFFIGSGEGWDMPKGADNIARVKALDGLMEYSVGGSASYLKAVQDYQKTSFSWRSYLRKLEVETGKKRLLIPTFQAAYDDTNVVPKRNNPPMYARSRDEVKYHAEMIRSGMGSVYDTIGPFVVYSELPEGAAVIESQCLPATMDMPGRFVGCGTGRLQILKEYFGGM
jgi:hypothetical protein